MSSEIKDTPKKEIEELNQKSTDELISLLDKSEATNELTPLQKDITDILNKRILSLGIKPQERIKYIFTVFKKRFQTDREKYVHKSLAVGEIAFCVDSKKCEELQLQNAKPVFFPIKYSLNGKLAVTKELPKTSKIYEEINIKYPFEGKEKEIEESVKKHASTPIKQLRELKNQNEIIEAIKRNSLIINRAEQTKLNELVKTIISEYEKNGKNIFDDFNDIYTFVEKWFENLEFGKANVGTAHHELHGINKQKSTCATIINDKEMLEYKNQKTQATLNVPKALGGKFYPATLRTFMVLTKIHTETNSHIPSFYFTVNDYIDICGLKDKKSAVELLKRDLEIITTSILKYTRNKSTVGQMNIIDKWELNKRTRRVEISFTQAYFDEIKYYPTGYISDSALKLNIHKHPNSLHFEFKANQHKRSNYGKKNENIISVKTLLNGANIPTYEEIKNQSESFNRKIVEPFERDINALDSIFTWEYCGDKGIQLTDKELLEFTYDQFIGFNVKITWKQYPDQIERMEKKKNYIEQSKTKKNRNSKKSK